MAKVSPKKIAPQDLIFHREYDEAYKKKMKKLLKDDEKEAISKRPKR